LFLDFLPQLFVPYSQISQIHFETVVVQEQARPQSISVDEFSADSEAGQEAQESFLDL
jgi:hypothetical protein